MKAKCQDCKYFKLPKEWEPYQDYGYCENPHWAYPFEFSSEGIVTRKNLGEDSVMITCDGYEASVRVGKEFGCIFFEPREKEEQ